MGFDPKTLLLLLELFTIQQVLMFTKLCTSYGESNIYVMPTKQCTGLPEFACLWSSIENMVSIQNLMIMHVN